MILLSRKKTYGFSRLYTVCNIYNSGLYICIQMRERERESDMACLKNVLIRYRYSSYPGFYDLFDYIMTKTACDADVKQICFCFFVVGDV